MRTRIKICGIRSADMAAIAVQSGADALGLMFYEPSSRHLEIEQAAEITRNIPPFVSLVGVMVNPHRDYVEAILKQVPLTHLQFHGEEEAGFCGNFGRPYIKGVRVSESADLLESEGNYPDASAILLDTHVADSYGGTGQSFDWKKTHYGGSKPIILAGGLTPENVAKAIETGSPYGVDVSSGVETDGGKDGEKIRRFCHNVLYANS